MGSAVRDASRERLDVRCLENGITVRDAYLACGLESVSVEWRMV